MKLTRAQNIAVIVAALLILVSAVVTTVVFNSRVGSTSSSDSQGYKNFTFTDAVIKCENQTRQQFGDRLRNLFVDNHSSRFAKKQNQFKIFLQADVYTRVGGERLNLHYVNCFVRGSNGSMVKFETFEDKGEEKASPVDDDTNIFGYPKKGK